ncbi:MAG: SHOCT domain-containing protein [Actinomycetota bacterium]
MGTPDTFASAGPTEESAGASHDAIEKLKELGQLHDQGILTDEEFSTQNAQVLGG